MADTKTTPRLLTLSRAAEVSGMSEQEILDLAAVFEITAGVIVPFWHGYAIPIKGRNLDIGVSNGKYSITGEWITTHYHVSSENAPAHTVPVFVLSKFWELGGEVAYLAREDKPKEISFLYPQRWAIKGLSEFMPWDDSMVSLVTGQSITRQDLRFVRSEIEAMVNILAAPTEPNKVAKAKPGRPTDPNALNVRLDELKADAIEQAEAFKVKHGKTPRITDVANILACSDTWCVFSKETIEPKLKAAWWK